MIHFPDFVSHYPDVVQNVRVFNEALEQHPKLRSRLSYTHAWYFVPELDAAGPSKFIGYKGMTAEFYLANYYSGLHGNRTETESHLRRWFEVVDHDTAEHNYVFGLIHEMAWKYLKIPRSGCRYNVPVGWRVIQS